MISTFTSPALPFGVSAFTALRRDLSAILHGARVAAKEAVAGLRRPKRVGLALFSAARLSLYGNRQKTAFRYQDTENWAKRPWPSPKRRESPLAVLLTPGQIGGVGPDDSAAIGFSVGDQLEIVGNGSVENCRFLASGKSGPGRLVGKKAGQESRIELGQLATRPRWARQCSHLVTHIRICGRQAKSGLNAVERGIYAQS